MNISKTRAERLKAIEAQTAELRNRLTDHRLYTLLSEIEDVRIFMEKHVYAVWDFMSLLKALQMKLTCIRVPWTPARNPKTARFINEIVFGEESDTDEAGMPRSHFEMYTEAMEEAGADTLRINALTASVNTLDTVAETLEKADLKPAEKAFLDFTFAVIKADKIHEIAAAFTFGREDVIPDMFIEITEKSGEGGRNQYPKLTYYLKRHIELDGDEHGPLSLEMISELCGDDEAKWQDVLRVSQAALRKRLLLWDEIASEIEAAKELSCP